MKTLIALALAVLASSMGSLGDAVAATPAPGVPAPKATVVLEGKVSLLLPPGFKPLSTEVLNRKYPNANRPNLVYSNDATTVNVALEHTPHAVTAEQLATAHEQLAAGLKGAYPTATWFSSGMRQINGRPFFVMEVRTPAVDTEVRNLIVGTSVDNRLLMISFNTTRALETEWMPIGRQVIESIRVK
jgi:hypothetical protein